MVKAGASPEGRPSLCVPSSGAFRASPQEKACPFQEGFLPRLQKQSGEGVENLIPQAGFPRKEGEDKRGPRP